MFSRQKESLRGISVLATVFLTLVGIPQIGLTQRIETEIEVFDFSDGLSHRNIFGISQDEQGYLWLATFNGLNRFDGYRFRAYRDVPPFSDIEADFTNGIAFDESGQMWVSSPDYLTVLKADGVNHRAIKIKAGPIERRRALVPTAMQPYQQSVWLTTQEESSGANDLQLLTADGRLRHVLDLPGQYAQRPLALHEDALFVGYHEQLLYQIDPVTGSILGRDSFPGRGDQISRIVDLATSENRLWVLLDDGRIFFREGTEPGFQQHPVSLSLQTGQMAQTLFIAANGDLWIGGLGHLWQYSIREQELIDHDKMVRQIVRNTCNYRQIFQDISGTIWVASDFGAIRIGQNDQLFSHYLYGGSEYCSNVLCSTRGITEDDAGNIYISYYNSIHRLDPQLNSIRPLFPGNDYYNYPFGVLHDKGVLYTGNGLRIELATLEVDTLFRHPSKDLGAVMRAPNGQIWFGYQHFLYRYDPTTRQLSRVPWEEQLGTISYLFANEQALWVGTIGHGLYRQDFTTNELKHYDRQNNSPARLASNQVNAIHQHPDGTLFLATGEGLQALNPQTDSIETYGKEHGLPNLFVNGILPEGDSCLWLSTDYGLCRFSLATKSALNFFTTDGLSDNEFNRISFFRSRSGRLYFGGLNGVNAFYPGQRFLEHKAERRTTPLLLTGFSYLDAQTDSLRQLELPREDSLLEVYLSYQDRVFITEFALADYRNTSRNLFSYYLEGYDQDWSEEQTDHRIRFNDIPPGDYTLHVRGRAPGQPWSPDELAIPIYIRQPYYMSIWFWMAVVGGVFLGLLGLARYRIYLAERNRQELEQEVARRTRELEAEKQKSEELLLNILPAKTAEELKRKGFASAQRYDHITVLFSDFKNFTRISEQLQPEQLVAEIDFHFRAFDAIIDRNGLEKIKTIGDAYLCVGGLDGDGSAGARKAVAAALEIQAFMHRSAVERIERGAPVFEARIGLHTGPVVAGVVGTRKFAYDIWGETVNIASRIETNGTVGRVNISEQTYRLVSEEYPAEHIGDFHEHQTTVPMYMIRRNEDVKPSV